MKREKAGGAGNLNPCHNIASSKSRTSPYELVVDAACSSSISLLVAFLTTYSRGERRFTISGCSLAINVRLRARFVSLNAIAKR